MSSRPVLLSCKRKSALNTSYTVTEKECAVLIIFGFLCLSPTFPPLTRLVSRQNGRVASLAAEQTETVAQINAIFSNASFRFLSPTFESRLTFTGRFFFRFERLEYFEEGNDLRRSVWRRRTEIQAHSSCAS